MTPHPGVAGGLPPSEEESALRGRTPGPDTIARERTVHGPNQALWEKGDFTRIAATMRESGEALVAALGVTPGMKVLDLGCGDGTTALPAAKLGADVLGVDIARNLVDAGNRRAQSAGPREPAASRKATRATCDGLADRRFDLVVSIFGAMFAPQAVRRRQGDGARDQAGRPHRHGQLDPERPDARRADPEDQLGLLAAAAGGLRQPDDLGRRGQRHRALRAAGMPKDRSRSSATPSSSTSKATPAQFVDAFREYYGPTMNAFDAASKSGRAETLRNELVRALREPEQERQRHAHVRACDLPARDGGGAVAT